MLNRIFGKKRHAQAPEKLQPGVQLAMPLLRTLENLTATKVAASWNTLFPTAALTKAEGEKDNPWSFASGGQSVFAMPIPMPVPRGDIESSCQRSWMWQEGAQATKQQRAHFIVTSARKGDAMNEAMMVSRICACIMHAAGADAVGVYWGNCAQVHQPEVFIDTVKGFSGQNGRPLPVLLWVGMLMSADSPKGPFTLTTCGLQAFGHKEFEVIDAPMSAGDLRMMILETINYVLENGPILLHGQTFGPDSQTKWIIEHVRSKFRATEDVIRLRM